MPKRGAEQQITKDSASGDYSDDEKPKISFASSDIMAKRKILKPKGRNFAFPSADSAPKVAPESPAPSQNGSKIKALNLRFVAAVKKSESSNGLQDLRPIAKKYLDYYTQIENGSLPEPKVADAPKSIFQTASALTESKPNPFSNISFGNKSTLPEQPKESPKPAAPASKQDESDDESEDEKPKPVTISGPTFTLSGNPTTKNSPFSFGSKPQKKAPVDSDSESEVEIKGPTFTFSKQILDPVFKLGKAEKEEPKVEEPKATAESKDKDKDPVSFGSSTSTNPFGKVSSTPLQPFSFTASQGTADATPKTFSFGGFSKTTSGNGFDTENKATGLLFGNKEVSFGSTQNAFGANLGSATQSFLFGSFNPAPSAPSNDTPSEKAEAEEEDTGGKFAPVASLGEKVIDDLSTGEEGEKVLFQKKTKLMLFEAENTSNPYKNLGVGELKVLESSAKKSARILVRAEGGLRVLLNVALLKDVTYATFGNGTLVRVPAVDGEGKIVTYVLKVKTAADAEELSKTLNSAKPT